MGSIEYLRGERRIKTEGRCTRDPVEILETSAIAGAKMRDKFLAALEAVKEEANRESRNRREEL